MLRRELQAGRMDGTQNSHGQGHGHNPSPQAGAAPPAPAPASNSQPPSSSYAGSDPYAPSTGSANSNRTELPPLRSLHGGPDSMTGVQYDAPRANGYRQERY